MPQLSLDDLGYEFPHIIDSTMRRDLVSCQTKFLWSTVRRIRPAGESIHLKFGASLARGLEMFRKSWYGTSEPMSFDAALAAGSEALILEWGDYEHVGPSTSKSLVSCLDALYTFFTVNPPARDPMQPLRLGDGTPAIEFSFALPIPGLVHPLDGQPILYAGRSDMISTYHGQVWVDDEKSTGQLGDHWAEKWDLRAQFTGYVWAAQQFGHDAKGVLVNGIGIYSKEIKCVRHLSPRKPWEVDRWLVQLQRDVDKAIHAWSNHEWDLNLDNSCDAYGGCSFRPLCNTQHPERFLNMFERNLWNPLERDVA